MSYDRARYRTMAALAVGCLLFGGALWAAPEDEVIPEDLREHYFLVLHTRAEKAYEAGIFKGEIVTFYGEGLYEDPAIGWEPNASDGVREASARSASATGGTRGGAGATQAPSPSAQCCSVARCRRPRRHLSAGASPVTSVARSAARTS